MMLVALSIFLFCFWAIFSRKFTDGIVAKNLLAIAAITAWLVIIDPSNYYAASSSIVCLTSGLIYWLCRKHKLMPPNPRRRVTD